MPDDRIGRLAADPLREPEAVEAQPLEVVDERTEAVVVRERPGAEAEPDPHLHVLMLHGRARRTRLSLLAAERCTDRSDGR